MKEAQDNFILSKYLLNSIILTQYHHICLDDANALLQHWMQRQAAGEIPLQFKNNIKANCHGTQASEDGDTSTPVLRDQSEGGLQNAWEDPSNVSLAPVSWLQQMLTAFDDK